MYADLTYHLIHHLVPVLDLPWADGPHGQQVILGQPPPTPTPPTGGGPDFSKITPDSRGVPKAGVLYFLAQVMLWIGLGISFIVLITGIIGWAGGHIAGGMHISQNAKTHIVRAAVAGLALTTAGGLWTWITSVS